MPTVASAPASATATMVARQSNTPLIQVPTGTPATRGSVIPAVIRLR